MVLKSFRKSSDSEEEDNEEECNEMRIARVISQRSDGGNTSSQVPAGD